MAYSLGQRLKKIRKSLGWSQSKLGKKLGVTASAIVYWEQGERQISLKMLQKIARVTQKPVSIFYEDPENALITESVDSIALKVESLSKLLKDTEQKYRQIVETAQEGILVLDDKVNITFVNQKLGDMFGYSIEEMIRKNLYNFAEFSKQPVSRQFIKNLTKKTPPYVEIKLRKKNGINFYVLVSITKMFDSNGVYKGILALFTDVTERKKTEKMLIESEHRSKAIISAIPDMLFILDINGKYIDFKADSSDDLAFPASALIGRNIKDIGLSEEDLKKAISTIKEVLSKKTILSFDYKLNVPNGEKIWSARVAPLNKDEVVCIVRESKN